jgi:hypothetical protein
MYKNKKFTDLQSGRVVQVTDQFEDIVILDGKTKIKMNKLLDNRLYDEYIDPMNFFRNEGLANAFAEKIRQLPNDVPQQHQEKFDSPRQLLNNYGNPYDYVDDSPAVLPYDPEEEKQQLIMKAKKMFDNRQNQASSQLDKFKDILGDDELNDLNDEVNTKDYNNSETFEDIEIPQKPNPVRMENIANQSVSTPPQTQQQSMDPIIQMFRNVKRNTDFNIKFEINNKIPRLDFIEMMEDSYNTSIIDFLAEEFTNQILLNPQIIKNRIKDQIVLMLHKKANSEASKNPDTQVKQTTTRKKTVTKND